MYHTGQECRFVLKVADAETLQASNATPPNGICAAGTVSISLPLELCVISTGQAKLADIGDNYKCAREDAFVAGFRTFDQFRTKNDVQGPGHGPCRNLGWILLDTNFLPVGEFGSIDLQLPC
jgi:hypothetical protein